jgi:hypothetical protein
MIIPQRPGEGGQIEVYLYKVVTLHVKWYNHLKVDCDALTKEAKTIKQP